MASLGQEFPQEVPGGRLLQPHSSLRSCHSLLWLFTLDAVDSPEGLLAAGVACLLLQGVERSGG